MKRSLLNRLFGVVFVLALVASVSAAQNNDKQLPNFHKVNDHLYRGGQPDKIVIAHLRAMGIKTIVNLRGRDKQAEAEEDEARRAGLHYFNIEMAGWGRPTFEQVSKVLEIINAPEYWPVFIHCKRGADRTGTILACYRVANEGWTAEQAVDEASRHGMHWTQFWMKDFISDFAKLARNGQLSREGDEMDGGSLSNRMGSAARAAEGATRKGHNALGWLFGKL
jgi:protein tyrosine phosphatase (PTP) superfamily phosphohydrolase (DUF442 family)